MLIIFELDFKSACRPFKFKGSFDKGVFYRVGVLWFSVSLITKTDIKSHHDLIASGATIWKK